MNDQPKTGRLEVPTFRGLIWLVASITGLWFVVRAGDPRQIGENLYPYYVSYAAAIFLAFEWGRVFGGLFYEWWANYIQVFISVAVPTIVLWFIWGSRSYSAVQRCCNKIKQSCNDVCGVANSCSIRCLLAAA